MPVTVRRLAWRILRVLVAAWLAACVLLTLLQSKLIWFPGKPGETTPRDVALDYEDLTLATQDGERLHAWFLPAQGESRGALLVSHGNAGTIEDRLEIARYFVMRRVSVLLYDYRGYGSSTGSPSEEGTYLDARAAWNELVERRGIAPDRILLYGESLGGGVAVQLATETKSAGLILHDTFSSLADAAAHHYPWLPVRLLLRVHYDNLAKIARVAVPLLLVHSPDDEVIPYEQGRRLYEAAAQPKEFIATSGSHNSLGFLGRPDWQARVQSFVARTLP